MQVQVKHSRDHHNRKEFRPYVDGQHAVGTEVKIEGEDYLIMREEDILAIVE